MISCTKEEAVPVTVDFEMEIFKEDYSIPVQVLLINKSQGADTYEWKFTGAVPETSTSKNPSFITYNQKGIYKVELTASNRDGSQDYKSLDIQIDDPVRVDFSIDNVVDNFSPAKFKLKNLSYGANTYSWTFEGGTPSKSDLKDPDSITFAEPGLHTITLEVGNGRESYTLQKSISVAPYLQAGFDFEVVLEDDDFEIPVKTKFINTSVSATSYQWTFEGAEPNTSNDPNPEVIFTSKGTHNITLTATNGKETKSFSKQITVTQNTNLRSLTNIKLGINTAHNSSIIGGFYNLNARQVFTAADLLTTPNANIDLVFFGLSSDFSRNKFVSPDNLQGTTFSVLEHAKKTIFINSQELCSCSASLSASQFDNMQDDTLIKNLIIEETPGGLQAFNAEEVSRVVLFQTQEGKKGAIKIKAYQKEGNNSYIFVDIKVQKEK